MNAMDPKLFHPVVGQWFSGRFGEPTDAQRFGWPVIAAGHHTLIAAPTGSGKTLAAFLGCLDGLFRQWFAGELSDGIQVVYVSPLKALSNDIEKNLRGPLAEISELALQAGHSTPPIRVAVRTGDTPSSQRQAMLRRPPHILVTTPESLYLLLTSAKPRELLKTVHTVIVDEIHAVARDKRGSHLAITLERLAALADERPRRIGLSATQRPLDQIARFLAGSACRQVTTICPSKAEAADVQTATAHSADSPADDEVVVIDSGHVRELDLAIEVPPSELEAVCSNEQWAEIYGSLTDLIRSHRSTLIFVNTRRLAERVTLRLSELLGAESVASHHGSLSRELRLSAEERLKSGKLKALVATASLEMGIDIGFIDLVCQLGSPRSIATLLQRIGRSGHHLNATPKGRLFPLTRDELLECMALVRAIGKGKLDAVEIPQNPLDILAQQIVATVACEEWNAHDLWQFMCRAWPFRDLTEPRFIEMVNLLSNGMTPGLRRGSYLHFDQLNGRLRARRNARLTAITSGGAIPESAEYRVVAQPQKTFVGTVDEDFAIESMAGDIFLLGNTSWQVLQVKASEVAVRDAEGAPPTIPFWFGEAPGRTIELSQEISDLRRQIGAGFLSRGEETGGPTTVSAESLQDECGLTRWGAKQAIRYVESQYAAIGVVPTCTEIVFERFFDESGGMQLVIHAPFGARVNRAWGLALRKRFCRSFDFELQAAATDNGILLSIGPQHSFPIEALFKMLGVHNARDLLEQAVLVAPMFQVRWRWNVTRALAVLRTQAGKKVPPALQRFRSDDLLAAAFPETVGCLENHHGDVEIPDHPLVQQTMHDCLHEAMDIDRWLTVLEEIKVGKVRLIARETREPSPFSYELLTANPYAFLDDAPLEERRARAVQTRRGLATEETRDLGRLDSNAIAQVCREAWPVVRDADELHDALRQLGCVTNEGHPEWLTWFGSLVAAGRATTVRLANDESWWIASESWPQIRAIYPDAVADPCPALPPELDRVCDRTEALTELVRGQLHCRGPLFSSQLAADLEVAVGEIDSVMERLEGMGVVMRGRFRAPTDSPHGPADEDSTALETGPIETDPVKTDPVETDPVETDPVETEWCDRRLLARIHRLTVDGLRRQIQPVSAHQFLSFLSAKHRLTGSATWTGQDGLLAVVNLLQAYDVPLAAWEPILKQRVSDYDPQWLDYLLLSGELSWGRIRLPNPESGRVPRVSLNRSTPVSFFLRENLADLLRPDSQVSRPGTSAAAELHDLLRSKGALFVQELTAMSSLLASQVEEGLRELTALGLVTSDSFAAVRYLARLEASRRSHRVKPKAPPGRWSCFAGQPTGQVERPAQLEQWCRLLLQRYGVVFRDLLVRESAAPVWGELVRVFRRMELRGEVRGGRFVKDVAGEQYALEDDVSRLRRHRDAGRADGWTMISAADPLNLAGIVGGGPRVPALHKNFVVMQEGHWVAGRVAGIVEFFDSASGPVAEGAADQPEIARALHAGRRATSTPVFPTSERRRYHFPHTPGGGLPRPLLRPR